MRKIYSFIIGLCLIAAPVMSQINNTAAEIAGQMTIGWNIGNSLEVPDGETAWGNPMVNQQLINAVQAAGFNTIRIPCAWNSYAIQSTYVIDASWMARVKEVVDYAYNNGMFVILNSHWDGGWLEENPYYSAQSEVNAKQESYWTQIANYFQNYDEHLLFAGCNEVRADYNAPTTEYETVQESYLQTFVDAVRATGGNNATRTLIVQTYNTNIWHGLDYFTMPTDPASNRLMVEIHHYDPYQFTITGDCDYWGNSNTSSACSWADEAFIEEMFAQLKNKWPDNGIPVLMGEYGAIKQASSLGDELHNESRNYWLRWNTALAKASGVVPVYWDNGYYNDGFALFDRNSGAVVDQGGIDALMEGAGVGGSTNQAPNAALSASPTNGTSPLTVFFNASGSSDPDGDALSYNWSFGDGSSGIGENTSHTYSSAGNYTATVTVSDGSLTDNASQSISVSDGNTGCTWIEYQAEDGYVSAGSVDNNNSGFTGTGFVNTDNTIDVYFELTVNVSDAGAHDIRVVYANGSSVDRAQLVSINGSNAISNLSFPTTGSWTSWTTAKFSANLSAGNNTIRFTSLTTSGAGNFDRIDVCQGEGSTENSAPNAIINVSPTGGAAPLLVSFDASSSSDPDGDAISYSWSFGDGATGSGSITSHTYTSAGNYLATVTVSDGSLTDNASQTITVSTGNIPVTGIAVSPASFTLTEGQTQQLTATISPSNATNQSVSWSTSNSTVATISPPGLVTAQSTGSATITVTTSDGNYTSSSFITVESGGNGDTDFCDNPTSITIPFTHSGAGEYCWVTTQEIAYINSWGLNELTINGVDFTNSWSNSLPDAVDGQWTIYYSGDHAWSHFEAPQLKSTGAFTQSTDIHLYPNPFTESTKLIFDAPELIKRVIILDHLGRQVSIINQSEISQNMVIGEDLASGLYIIQVYDNASLRIFTLTKK